MNSRPPTASLDSDGLNYFQIFLNPPSRKSTLIWVHPSDSVTNLKINIANHIGYPNGQQLLLFEGRWLQDHRAIKDYNIKSGSTIILNMRLRGGVASSSPPKQFEGGSGSQTKQNPDSHQKHKGQGISSKNVLEGGKSSTAAPKQVGTEPSPYIVEQLHYTPELTIETSETEEVCNSYEK